MKKLASILCAVSILSAIAAPGFAAENHRTLPPHEASPSPSIEADRLVYYHKAISGNRPCYSFTLEEPEQYFRVAVYNGGMDRNITVYIYKQGSSDLFTSLTAKPGEWTPNRAFQGETGTTYEAIISVAEGFDPSGKISVRVSPHLLDVESQIEQE